MSTRSLLLWVALVAGVELAVRGYLDARPWTCHGGALLFALGVAGFAWPTRRRGAGLAAAALLVLLAALDAGWAARVPARAAEPAEAASVTGGAAGALGDRLHCPADVALLDVSESATAWQTELERSPRLALVYADDRILDAMRAGAPELRALGRPAPARGSPLVAALEARWLRHEAEARWQRLRRADPSLDPARSPVATRYREALLAARRSGAEVRVVVDAPSADAPAATPEARARWLAARLHLHLVRGVAGAYGLRVVELGSGKDVLRELVASDAGCRELAPSAPEASGRGSGRTA